MSREINAPSAAPGIAIAPVFHHRNVGEFIPTVEIFEHQAAAECERFDQACERASEALLALKERLTRDVDGAAGIAGIYDAHIALITDPYIRKDVRELIEGEGINAEVALQRVVTRYEKIFESVDSATVRERAADIRDVGRQILNMLLRRDREELGATEGDFILAVDEFLPSDLGVIDTDHVRGILMGEGGRYSHGAILAKSLGIPCLVGLEQNLVKLPAGHVVILDGDRGRLIVEPTDERIEVYRERMREREASEKRVFEVRLSPAVTTDDVGIELLGNVESIRELSTLEAGVCDGVGLFRTEFAFMERLMFPSEEEQLKLYVEVVEAMRGRRVTFRTLDVGGDKPLAYFRTPAERNPVLGWRGLRLMLQWRDILYTQIRALVRTSASGPVSILLPMVTTVEEVQETRGIIDEVIRDLRADGVEVGDDLMFGIMIEVPAIAVRLEHVLAQVDFVSVGSNDLVQYLLAVDRDNPRVASMYDPYHPGVLGFLASLVAKADAANVPISLCGEIAGESDFTPLLLGMGFRRLSMTPVFFPPVKLAIRSRSMEECRAIWDEASALATAAEVRELLRRATRVSDAR